MSNNNYKKILVTGGAGFIGSFLVDSLISKGYEVRIFDNLEYQVHQGKVPSYLNAKAEFVQGDVRDYEAFKGVLDEVDIVFHLAAAVGVGQSNYEIKRFTDANVGGTANLFDILINHKKNVKKVITASSMTCYGEGNYSCKNCGVVRPALRDNKDIKKNDWNLYCSNCSGALTPIPTDESALDYPNSVYALGKKMQQDLAVLLGNIYQLPTTVLKFFNVYGPRQSLSNPYTGVAAIFISRIKNNQSPIVYEDGLQTRDFVSVHDVVDGLIASMEPMKANSQIINIGSGIPTPILEIAQILRKLLNNGKEIELKYEYRKNDIRHCYADITKARKFLDWQPKISLEAGLKELIEWSQNEKAEDSFAKAQEELRSKGLI